MLTLSRPLLCKGTKAAIGFHSFGFLIPRIFIQIARLAGEELTLFVSVAIERVPMGKVVRHLVPFYLAALVVLALVSFLPGLSMLFL